MTESDVMMLGQYLRDTLASVEFDNDPWPHAVVHSFFPSDVYRQMDENFPAMKSMHPLSRTTTNRFVYWLVNSDGSYPHVSEYWDIFRSTVFGLLWAALEDKCDVMGSVIGSELVHDMSGYGLGPHTDTPDKLITALLYMPETREDDPQQGTILFRSDTPDPRGKGHRLGDPAYTPVKIIPYEANTLLFFMRTDISFHGVAKSPIERRLLAFDVFK